MGRTGLWEAYFSGRDLGFMGRTAFMGTSTTGTIRGMGITGRYLSVGHSNSTISRETRRVTGEETLARRATGRRASMHCPDSTVVAAAGRTGKVWIERAPSGWRRPFTLERCAPEPGVGLEVDDVDVSPGVAKIFGDEAAMTMVGLVFAAKEAGSVELIS